MNNLFQYTKTEGQGWLVEKPEMVEPIWEHWGSDERGFEAEVNLYEQYLATLRRFKYDYPDPGKEMELGKDFEVNYRYVFQNEKSEPYAMPIYKDDENVTQRTYSEQEMQEKDLIIQGIEEGAENWKAEYDNCRAILQLLVELKRVKDTEGKTEFYEKNQPITWEAAKRFLEKYTHIDY